MVKRRLSGVSDQEDAGGQASTPPPQPLRSTLGPAATPIPGAGGIFKTAAIEVLRSERRLLSTGDITRTALRLGILRASGKTPEATMASALYTDVKKKGDASAFTRPQEGLFGLREWLAEGFFPDGYWSEAPPSRGRAARRKSAWGGSGSGSGGAAAGGSGSGGADAGDGGGSGGGSGGGAAAAAAAGSSEAAAAAGADVVGTQPAAAILHTELQPAIGSSPAARMMPTTTSALVAAAAASAGLPLLFQEGACAAPPPSAAALPPSGGGPEGQGLVDQAAAAPPAAAKKPAAAGGAAASAAADAPPPPPADAAARAPPPRVRRRRADLEVGDNDEDCCSDDDDDGAGAGGNGANGSGGDGGSGKRSGGVDGSGANADGGSMAALTSPLPCAASAFVDNDSICARRQQQQQQQRQQQGKPPRQPRRRHPLSLFVSLPGGGASAANVAEALEHAALLRALRPVDPQAQQLQPAPLPAVAGHGKQQQPESGFGALAGGLKRQRSSAVKLPPMPWEQPQHQQPPQQQDSGYDASAEQLMLHAAALQQLQLQQQQLQQSAWPLSTGCRAAWSLLSPRDACSLVATPAGGAQPPHSAAAQFAAAAVPPRKQGGSSAAAAAPLMPPPGPIALELASPGAAHSNKHHHRGPAAGRRGHPPPPTPPPLPPPPSPRLREWQAAVEAAERALGRNHPAVGRAWLDLARALQAANAGSDRARHATKRAFDVALAATRVGCGPGAAACEGFRYLLARHSGGGGKGGGAGGGGDADAARAAAAERVAV